MIDVSQLPAVREQLAQDFAALEARHAERAQTLAKASTPQYARAPSASGAPRTDVPPQVDQEGAL